MPTLRQLFTLFSLVAVSLTASATAGAHADAGHTSSPKAPRAPTLQLDDMIEHSAATWEMGISTDRDVGDYGNSWLVDQQPRFTVETDAFYLDETEVTVREFALFLTYAGGELHYHPDQPVDPVELGYRPEPGTADEPIRQVTWRAAHDYCAWAGKRLPTEAEWEFAATGEQRRTYPWGDDGGGCNYANYFVGRSWCADGPVEVGTHDMGDTPNGVADMGGNVAEWVRDWYADYPKQQQSNPTGPESGEYKVIRGGGFVASGQFLRSQARRAAEPYRRAEDVGFRCAVDGDIDPETVNGHLRGNLSLPPDVNRETEPRFPGEPAPQPDTVATGLDSPSDMIVHAGSLYVLADGTNSIVEVDPDSGETTTVLEDQSGMHALASNGDRIYIAVRNDDTPAQGEILELIPGMPPTTIATEQTNPGPIAASGSRVVWGTDSGLVSYDSSADSPSANQIVSEIAPVRALNFPSDTEVYYSAASLSNSQRGLKTSDFKLGRYNFSEETDNELLPGENSGNIFELFYISSITVNAQTGGLWTTFNQPGFPRHGYLCGLGDTEQAACLATHTPPRPDDITAAGQNGVFWTSQRSIVTYSPAGTWMGPNSYTITATWSAPRGLLTFDGGLYWADNQTGRILHNAL